MKVILLDNVQGVGKTGEMRDVSDGFGRNFLIPRGLALPATSGNIKKLEERAHVIIKRNERNVKTAEAIKERLEQAVLTIKKKAGVDGKLFGSVTPMEIAETIKKALDITVDKKTIRMAEPVKMIGAYTVDIHLERGVQSQLKIEIEAEQ
ncbi:MAG TPA: 50S ribosomal protein L9 [Deltaproteobacteria bacterium]|nr:50S ribosomal protein L9 [Deltaproteobacteria bacterium]